MKNLALVLLPVLFIIFSFRLFAQVQTDKFDPKEKVYWFYLSSEIKTDKALNRDVYIARTTAKKPKYNTFSAYEKDVWKCLEGGHQIVVGPFRDFGAAKQAIEIYDLAKLPEKARGIETKKLVDSSKVSDAGYYCYYLKFYITDRTKTIKLKRIPARTSVEGISLNDFLDQFFEGVTMEMLAIGPFSTRLEAEESKRLNRLEEK
jgi:hypothetical protein